MLGLVFRDYLKIWDKTLNTRLFVLGERQEKLETELINYFSVLLTFSCNIFFNSFFCVWFFNSRFMGNYIFVVTNFGCNLLFTSVFCLAWCSRFHIILAPDIWYLMSHNPIFSGPDRFVPGTRRKASAEKKQKLGLERKVLSTGRGGSRVCYFVISDCCVLRYIFWLTVE